MHQAQKTISTLTELTFEELMEIEVTTVSVNPEKLSEVASAVQVISGENIIRSGVTRLPGVLKIAPNLQVLQANSHSWSITARGFSGVPSAGGIIANKLLVMIDGRSIYTPLFGGVYWDMQNALLVDIDRIEVISGPGGTLWGANAVNGVINILSKSSKETQGLYISGAAGSLLKDLAELRYGGRSIVDSNLYFRVYALRYDQGTSELSGIASDTIEDDWHFTQGGFRMDYYLNRKTTWTLQGDVYRGEANKETRFTIGEGENILMRITHNFSEKSNLNVQLYFDQVKRRTPYSSLPFFYNLQTYEIDIRQRFLIGLRNTLLCGIGYRLREDETARAFIPPSRSMPGYNGFIMDDISIIPQKLSLTIGSKFLNNVFTGWEYQPSLRLAWMTNERNTIWSAVSRVVRTPSRFDADIVTVEKFQSEKCFAYELGYRVIPNSQFFLSIAAFYNYYDKLRSIDSANTDSDPQLELVLANSQLVLANSQLAESWGYELSFNYIPVLWWRLSGGYTFFDNRIWSLHAKVAPLSKALESVDTRHQFKLQSTMDLPMNLQMDFNARFIDKMPAVLTTPAVSAYFVCDVRLAWKYKFLIFSVVGQNLVEKYHTETGLSRIPRSIYGRITCHL